MQNSFQGDFDFSISEILLAHRYSFQPHITQTGYLQGRPVSGIVYSISGSALYCFEKEQRLLEEGSMIFLPKNCRYRLKNQSDREFLHITVNFEISGPHSDKIYDTIHDSFEAYSLLEKLLTVWTEKKQGFRPLAKSLLYELLYKYFRNLEKSLRTDDYAKISPAKRMLDSRYRENISVCELADACGFSETHFRRMFYKNFQCSPTEYRLKKRIALAKELLRTGEFTVAEIAVYIGFDDSSYFSRVFKAETGLTPSEYIASERKRL